MKKFVAILLVLVIVLGLCACNKAGNAPQEELTEDGRVKLSIGLTSNARVLSYDDNALTDWIEETCGVELEFVEYAGGTDVDTQISTTIAARQELPDILFAISLNENTMRRYGKDGYFLNLNKYYEDREGASKTFWTRLESELTEQEQQDVIRNITDPNTGGIYGIPSIQTSLVDGMQYQTWINVEWLDKVGKEKPTNKEEFVEVLRAFAETDCNGNGIDDEIPLFGSNNAGMGGHLLNWLINMFVYYDSNAPYIVDDSGKLVRVETTDEYREALKFINDLYKEGLLTSLAFTASANEMKQITTPSSGTALCGIFVGHLTIHTVQGNEVLYQYEPLQTWGNAVFNDNTNRRQNFITADCENPDAAFNLMMEMWTEECSYRIRYGEYGVNWDEADEGAISDLGLPCTFKIIRDPLMEQNTCLWFGGVACTLVVYSEGETAQLVEETNPWGKYKSKVHAESRRLFDEAAEKNNPPSEQICPVIVFTEEEKLDDPAYDAYTACMDYYKNTRTDFCKGGMDPNSDADWNAYLAKLDSLGLKDAMELAQFAYERQLEGLSNLA